MDIKIEMEWSTDLDSFTVHDEPLLQENDDMERCSDIIQAAIDEERNQENSQQTSESKAIKDSEDLLEVIREEIYTTIDSRVNNEEIRNVKNERNMIESIDEEDKPEEDFTFYVDDCDVDDVVFVEDPTEDDIPTKKKVFIIGNDPKMVGCNQKKMEECCTECDFKTDSLGALRKHMSVHDEGNMLSCNLCSFTCSKSIILLIHKRKHRTNQWFACETCPYMTRLEDQFKKHTTSHEIAKSTKEDGSLSVDCKLLDVKVELHDFMKYSKACDTDDLSVNTDDKEMFLEMHREPYECDLCDFTCMSSHELMMHRLVHDDNEQYLACNQCDFFCNDSSMLKKHKLVHAGMKFCDVPNCGFKTGTSYRLARHKKQHEQKGKPYECPSCDFVCEEVQKMIKHKKIHQLPGSVKKKHACEECTYSTNYIRDFNRHLRVHSGERPHVCMQCGHSFSEPTGLKRHMVRHTKKKYECDQCGVKFNKNILLIQHKRTHLESKSVQCRQCSYQTVHPKELERHEKLYSDRTPFNCDLCSYQSCDRSHLLRHKLVHTSLEVFECDECNYETDKLVNLQNHKRVHGAEKRYGCNECYYRTSYPKDMRRHMRMHSGVKPHQCDLCDYSCSERTHLRRHKKIHEVKMHDCPKCKNSYNSLVRLKTHMKTVHCIYSESEASRGSASSESEESVEEEF